MTNNSGDEKTVQTVEIKIQPEQIAIIGITILAIVGATLLAIKLIHVFVLFFVALVIAATLRRPMQTLKQWGIPRGPALILIYLGILGAIVGIFILIIPILVAQVGALLQGLPKMYSDLVASLENNPSELIRALPLKMPGGDQLAGQLQSIGGNILTSALGFGVGVIGFLTELFSILVLSMYLILDQIRMERFWLSLAPAARRPQYLAIWREIESHLGTYVRGQFFLMASIAVLATLGYFVIGLPYPLALGVLAGLLEFVPMIGPTLGAIPAVLVALSISPQTALVVAAYSAVIQITENNILVPRMMGHAVGVRPVTVIVAFFAFSSLLGLPGAFLAIPLAAILQVLMDHLIIRAGDINEDEPVERSNTVVSNTLTRIRHLRIQVLDRFRTGSEPVIFATGDQAAVDNQVDSLLSQADQALIEAAQMVVSSDIVEGVSEIPSEVNQAINDASELIEKANDKAEEDEDREEEKKEEEDEPSK